MRIERWMYPGFSWDFGRGGAQPKGPAREIPGWSLPERIQGASFEVVQGARTAQSGRQPDAQGAALLVRVGKRLARTKTSWHFRRGGGGRGTSRHLKLKIWHLEAQVLAFM